MRSAGPKISCPCPYPGPPASGGLSVRINPSHTETWSFRRAASATNSELSKTPTSPRRRRPTWHRLRAFSATPEVREALARLDHRMNPYRIPKMSHLHQPSLEDQKNFWNWHWQHWQERKTVNEWKQQRHETVLAFLRSLHLDDPSILDVGCGPGWFTERLARFCAVTGIGLLEEAIN